MNKIWLLATLVILSPGPGLSQTMEELINDGKWTFAIDVETGNPIWRTPVEFEPGALRVTQFGAFNRGAPTIYNGKLFRVSVDNHLIALDLKTANEIWKQKFADWREGYYA